MKIDVIQLKDYEEAILRAVAFDGQEKAGFRIARVIEAHPEWWAPSKVWQFLGTRLMGYGTLYSGLATLVAHGLIIKRDRYDYQEDYNETLYGCTEHGRDWLKTWDEAKG